MSTTLDQILLATRARVAEAKASADMAQLERLAAQHTPRGFGAALREKSKSAPAVIAELKRASPSKGMIRGSFHPAALALELYQAGASALSVLTEEEFFLGSLDYLSEVSAAVPLPLLRKDFIVDEFQVLEARANCADAILLIVAALKDAELRHLYRRAKEAELDVLCEVHDEAELQRAVDAGCEIIGVNNRNLKTFQVDLANAERLASQIPAGAVKVAESGINSNVDIMRLRSAGYQAFLIGESLMRVDHPGQALLELLNPQSVVR
jgi:indole-3-glycerol phosphate synthase